MGEFFHTILYVPIFNLLVFFYEILPGADIGFAIIALTVLIKLILWPFMSQSLKSQKALQELQPKIEELKAKHGTEKEALAKAMMELYQKEKVNPLASCLPLLIQLPILIALYRVLLGGFGAETLVELYPFVANPDSINHVFLGVIDLSVASLYLAILAGYFQFFQTRMLINKRPPKQVTGKKGAFDETMLASMNKSMLMFMPAITVIIGATLPAGLTLYWVTVNIVSILQQQFVFSKIRNPKIE
ncbi:MAG: YidC/Oxa1 family membrane protein insertase [Candidatus Uhrbacteria bacterium]|nr:YidC/Oxa1 family membrane protein insertase [Candidatus Uhrbacteria bacterium]